MTTPDQNILGVVLAGGRSSRFGKDKAMALLHGKRLIDHAIERLLPQCSEIAISGRNYEKFGRVDDLPSAGLGPLAALNGALAMGKCRGFSRVLTVACDNIDLPDDLVHQLGDGNAIVQNQPVIGIWECQLSQRLDEWLSDTGKSRSMMAWVDEVGASVIRLSKPVANINWPDDLKQHQENQG